jgi:hypothetical protein
MRDKGFLTLVARSGWYAKYLAAAACFVFLICMLVALVFQITPVALLFPGLLAMAPFALVGPLYYAGAKEESRVRLRLAVLATGVFLFCSFSTTLYSAWHLSLISFQTFKEQFLYNCFGVPIFLSVFYWIARVRLKSKKQLN